MFGRVYLNGIVQQSCDRGLWFITFSVADSLQNSIFCQQEWKEFVVETVRAIQKKSKDGNKLPLRVLHCKKQGMKQYGLCLLNHTCYSKLSQHQQKLLFCFLFAPSKIPYSCISPIWLPNREKEKMLTFIRIVSLPPTGVHPF